MSPISAKKRIFVTSRWHLASVFRAEGMFSTGNDSKTLTSEQELKSLCNAFLHCRLSCLDLHISIVWNLRKDSFQNDTSII